MSLVFLFTSLWGGVIVCSMIGWGFLLNNFIIKKYENDLGINALLGICLAITFGGVLNLFGLISRALLLMILFFGILFFVYLVFRFRRIFIQRCKILKNQIIPDKIYLAAILVFLFVLIIQYFSIVSVGNFNEHDDLQGYFVFPEKMIQTGSLGNDPYSERRLVSSLGGKSFLDSFVLTGASWQNLHLIDRGVGMFLFLLIVFSFLNRLSEVSGRLKVEILLVVVFASPLTANITALYLAAALFLGLFYFCRYDDLNNFSARRVLMFSLLVSGLMSLKSSLIPATVLIIFAAYINRFMDVRKIERNKLVAEFMAIAALSFVLLFPWMLALYRSSGTYLYPLLGSGIHGSVYGHFLTPYSQIGYYNFLTLGYQLLRPSFLYLSVLFLVFINIEFGRDKKKIFIIFTAVILSIAVTAFSTAGYGVERYTWPLVFSFSIFLMIELLGYNDRVITGIGAGSKYLASVTVFFVLGANINSFLLFFRSNIDMVLYGLSGKTLVEQVEIDRYKKMQSAVPMGENILARLEKNFLLDFKRNQVFIIDYPGGSSPWPGMPFLKGPEALSDYLLNHSVRYVAYSYASQAFFTREKFGNRLESSMNAWIRTEAEHTFDFQDNLNVLSKTRKIIYNDGSDLVLDLSQPVQNEKK